MVRSLVSFSACSLVALLTVITSSLGTTNALLFSGSSNTYTSVRQSPFGVNHVVCGESDVVRRAPLSSMSSSKTAMFASSSPAVLDKVVVEKKQEKAPAKDKKSVGNESWEVRIYNDGANTREHVARCLVRVTGLSENAAYGTMMQAHQYGIAVVGTWVFERAEMYYEALKQSGIVCDMNPVDEKK